MSNDLERLVSALNVRGYRGSRRWEIRVTVESPDVVGHRYDEVTVRQIIGDDMVQIEGCVVEQKEQFNE